MRQFVRYRRDADGPFLSAAALDGLVVNANQLENHPDTTSVVVTELGRPYLIDPMLWRFQVPAWWQKEDGTTKKNFAALARHYFDATPFDANDGVHGSVADETWRRVAANVIRYQRERITTSAGPLFSLIEGSHHPAALVAPYLLAKNPQDDRANSTMLRAAADAAGAKVIAHIALPLERCTRGKDLDSILAAITPDIASGCFLWFERMSEEILLSFADYVELLHYVIDSLAGRGVAVWHAHGNYTTAALSHWGMTGFVHALQWSDRGMPADQPTGVPQPSCRTYLTSLHQAVHFDDAFRLGRPLDADHYLRDYCDCQFCSEAVRSDRQPLDLMLETMEVRAPRGRLRLRPTEASLASNSFHFVWSRRQEVERFSSMPAADVLAADLERASRLTNKTARLTRLADLLQPA